jgi:hypothetical protein
MSGIAALVSRLFSWSRTSSVLPPEPIDPPSFPANRRRVFPPSALVAYSELHVDRGVQHRGSLLQGPLVHEGTHALDPQFLESDDVTILLDRIQAPPSPARSYTIAISKD